jgi:hypothetical protein
MDRLFKDQGGLYMSVQSFTASLRYKGFMLSVGIALAALAVLHCNSDPASAPAETPAVQILAPAAGAKFKATDTNYIIIQTDTLRFLRRAFYIAFSTDSGACWAPDCGKGNSLTPLRLLGNKGALRKDTVKWVPADDPFISVGQTVKVRVVDYPPSTITLFSGYFTITN